MSGRVLEKALDMTRQLMVNMDKIWRPQFHITPIVVRQIVAQQFSQLCPIHVEAMDSGWDNAVFLINRTFVFRFPRRHVAVPLIETEQRLLPWLATRMSIDVPHPTFIGSAGALYPYPFFGYPLLPGQPIHKLELRAAALARVATALGVFLRTLHAIPLNETLAMKIPPDTIGRMDIDDRLPKYIQLVKAAKERALIRETDFFLQLTTSLPSTQEMDKSLVLAHGDLNFRNFLADEKGQLTGVIDWGDVHIGHPAVDLAIVPALFPPEVAQVFWQVYGEIDTQTWHLARFRAAYTLFNILLSADDMGDIAQVREAQRELTLMCE